MTKIHVFANKTLLHLHQSVLVVQEGLSRRKQRNSSSRHNKMEKFLEGRQYNATIQHPFTMCVCGPSGSGKSTFVSQLMLNRQAIISQGNFDYVYFLIGTLAKQNPLFVNLASSLKKTGVSTVEIWEINEMYSSAKARREEFPDFIDKTIQGHFERGEKGCLIIDDLMKEMADMDVLTNAFTRMSTHQSLSVIFITQNIFYHGKNASAAITIYRNTKYLVLFVSRVDKSTIRFLVQRMGQGKNNHLLRAMIDRVLDKHRYLMINFDINRNPDLMFSTQLFAESPIFEPLMKEKIPHQTVISPRFPMR